MPEGCYFRGILDACWALGLAAGGFLCAGAGAPGALEAQPVQRARVLRASPSPAREQGTDQRLTPRSDAASCGVTLAALQRAC